MPSEIYVFHPGVGQRKSGAPGPIVITRSGTNFVHIEQDFPSTQTTTAYFHGAVVPPDLLGAGNVIFRITLRQVTAGSGLLAEFGVYYNTLTHPTPPTPYSPTPPDRDTPMTLIGTYAVPIPGVVGQEVSVEFSLPVGTFTSGDELLLAVERVIGGSDTFAGGTMGLVRLDTEFPIQGGGGGTGEWSQTTDPGPPSQDFIFPIDGASRKVSIGTVTTAPTAASGSDPGAMFRVEQGHIEVQGVKAGDWDGPHFVIGKYHLWFDTVGNLRVKDILGGGAITGPLDGTIVGTQS